MSDSLQPHRLYSPPGSTVHGISQARILEWVTISFSRGSSRPRDRTWVSCTDMHIIYHWATWEALWIALAKDKLTGGEKITQFLVIFKCMGVHKKEVKLGQVVQGLVYPFGGAAMGLRCCPQAFSRCSEQVILELWCAGFSLQWVLLLRSMRSTARASAAAAQKFWNMDFSTCGAHA